MKYRIIPAIILLIIALSNFPLLNSPSMSHAYVEEDSLSVSLGKILYLDKVPHSNNTLISGGRFNNTSDLEYWNINADKRGISLLPSPLQIWRSRRENGLHIVGRYGFAVWQTLDSNAVEAVKGYKMLFGVLVATNTTAKVSASISYTTSQGGGCPLLYVWNGSSWVFDNNLLPKGHLSYSSDRYLLNVFPMRDNIKLKIIESGDSITFLDSVKLYGIIHPVNTMPVIEAATGKIILLDLRRTKDLLTPYYVRDIFGNNITLIMKRPDNSSYELAPKTWIVVYFKDIGHLKKPILLIRSDPPIPPVYKMSLIIQVYEKGVWKNITILSPRYRFYVDAIDISKYLPKHSNELILRIIATAYHRIDWIALASANTYRTKGYKLVELALKNASLISNHDTEVDATSNVSATDNIFLKIEKDQELYLVFKDYQPVGRGRKVSYLLDVQGYYKIIGGSTVVINSPEFIIKPHSLAWHLVYVTAYIPEDATSVTVYVTSSDYFDGYLKYAHALIEPATPTNVALVAAGANTGYYVESDAVAGIYAAYVKYDNYVEVVFAPAYVRYSYYEYHDPSGKVFTGPFHGVAKQYIGVSITGENEQVTINRATIYYANDMNATDISAEAIEWNRKIESLSVIGGIASIALSFLGYYLGGPAGKVVTLISISTGIFSVGLMALNASSPQVLSGTTAYKEVLYTAPYAVQPYNEAVSLSIMGYKVECSILPADLPVSVTIQYNTEYDIYPNPPEVIKVTYTINP